MQENASHMRFYNLSQWCILAIAFLLPFLFLPTTVAPVEFNKVFLVSVLVIASFVFYLIHAAKKARIEFFVHKSFILGAGALLFWILSAVFSDAGPSAIWGTGAEVNSFFTIFILFLLSYLIAMLFSQEKYLKKLFLAFFSGFIIFGAFVFLSFLWAGKFICGGFENSLFNTIGSWNSVALASTFVLLVDLFLVNWELCFQLRLVFPTKPQ